MIEIEESTHLDTPVLSQRAGRAPWWPVAFGGFLVLYMGLLAWFCSVKVLAFDEMLSFYTERATSMASLLALQRSHPVSLDPPLMHLAAHWALGLGINPIFCVRLPSLVGAAVMTACTFIFVRRLAGTEIAAFAVVALLITNQFHLVEARPYGALLGLAALALALWQNAIRGQARRASLIGLFLALGIATGSHYFGLLLVLPFLLAEVVRSVGRRRIDFGMLAALSGSLVFVAIWLPFLQGAHQYKANYYIGVHAGDLAGAYVSSLQTALGLHSAVAEWALFGIALLAVGGGAWVGYRGSQRLVEWTVVVGFALLPVAGVVLAMIASGAFENRYVSEFTLGTVICLSAGLVWAIRWRPLRVLLLAGACVLALAGLASKVRLDRAQRGTLEALAQNITTSGASTVTLITDKEEFLWLHTYAEDMPAIKRAVWVADLQREIAFSKSDNIDRTMLNLKIVAGLPVIPYEQVTSSPSDLRMIINSSTQPASWLPQSLAASGIKVSPAQNMGVVKDDRAYQLERGK